MDFDQLKDQILTIGKQYYDIAEDFVLDMTFELAHDYLFLNHHFPFFFILQSIFICYVIRRYAPKMKPSESFLTATGMILAGRALTAYFTLRPPVLFENVLYVPMTMLIWAIINYFPFDLAYKIISFGPIVFVLQLVNALIQVRESIHGFDTGLRAFPSSAVGALLISVILSSTESLLWLLKNPETRDYSPIVVLRNLFSATIFFIITNYPELFNDYFPTDREYVMIGILCVYEIIVLLNDIFFGLRSCKSIDITFVTYISRLFTYSG